MAVSSACSVIETTRMPLSRSKDLYMTACSRLRVNLENFQTRISRNGTVDDLASSIILLKSGLLATRPLSASSMNSRTTTQSFFSAYSLSARSCAATDRSTSCRSLETLA